MIALTQKLKPHSFAGLQMELKNLHSQKNLTDVAYVFKGQGIMCS